MDWSVSTSSTNYVMFKFPICFPCVLGKVNFFNQLNFYRKMVQKFHHHRWIPFKIKENTQIQITVQFLLKSPGVCLSVICPYTWKYLNSRIIGVSTLCSLLHFQSYFSFHFISCSFHPQVFFPKLDEHTVFTLNFQFLKTDLELCKTCPAFGECHNRSASFKGLWNTFITVMLLPWKP